MALLPNEEWRNIEGYEGLYQVSNLGRVKSCGRTVFIKSNFYKHGHYKTYKPKMIKQSKDAGGYLIVSLYDATNTKNSKNVKVHRLVAQAFINNPSNLPQIDHIDGNRDNNCVCNLAWVTCKTNANNPITISRKIESAKGSKPNRFQSSKYRMNSINGKIPIVQLQMNGEFVKEYNSATDAHKETGFAPSFIAGCCKGKFKSAYGFKWMYKLDYYKLNTN